MKLREWLRANKISQEDFGLRLGITQGRVSQICVNGTLNLPIALAIFDLTEGAVTPDELLWHPRPGYSKAAAAAEAL